MNQISNPPNVAQAGMGTLAPRDYHDIISKVAAVKDVDVDKLQKLMTMQEDWEKRQAETHWNNQMSFAQADMTQISKDSANQITRSKYASLEALDEAIRPIYTRHGFSVTFNDETPLDRLDSSWLRLIAYVSNGAHTRRYDKWLPVSTTGIRGQTSMTPTHASIGAVTYGRRALLKMIFNLAEVDDDGDRTSGFKQVEPESGRGGIDSPGTADEIIAAMRACKDHSALYAYGQSNRAVYLKLSQPDRKRCDEVYKQLMDGFAAQQEPDEQK